MEILRFKCVQLILIIEKIDNHIFAQHHFQNLIKGLEVKFCTSYSFIFVNVIQPKGIDSSEIERWETWFPSVLFYGHQSLRFIRKLPIRIMPSCARYMQCLCVLKVHWKCVTVNTNSLVCLTLV